MTIETDRKGILRICAAAIALLWWLFLLLVQHTPLISYSSILWLGIGAFALLSALRSDERMMSYALVIFGATDALPRFGSYLELLIKGQEVYILPLLVFLCMILSAVISIIGGAAQGKSEAAKKLYLALFISGVAAGAIFLLCFLSASDEMNLHLGFLSFWLPVLVSTLFIALAGGSMIDSLSPNVAQAAVGEEDDSDSYYD